jgi:putative membrane protein
MRIASVIGLLVGVALAVWLVADTGWTPIAHLLGQATWSGLAAVVAFHVLQMLPSAGAWRAVAGPSPPSPGFGRFMVLRWIREGANNLLPVAQIGGDVIAARLLARRGPPTPDAIAATVCDQTLETGTQIVFVVIGLALVPAGLLGGTTAITGVVIACLFVAAFVAVQVGGGAGIAERLLLRLGEAIGRHEFRHIEGMEAALRRRYRAPGPLLRGGILHLVSWLSGALEVCLIMHVLGHDVGLRTGLLLESLGQAAKSVGFAVPGGIGVQEGGYAAVAAALGLPPGAGIALSLVKRLREVVLGLPALAVWQRLEALVAVPVSARS